MEEVKKWLKPSKIVAKKKAALGLTTTSMCSSFVTKGKIKVLLVVLPQAFKL